MKVVLKGISGPGSEAEIVLEQQAAVTVGRNPTCTLSIPDDRFISGVHLELKLVGRQVLLRDLTSTNGTYLNGARITEQVLQASDTFLAGESTFCVRFEDDRGNGRLRFFSEQPGPVYAVLDAARDPAIYMLLQKSGCSFWNLYIGQSALDLEIVAPYLVYLPPQSDLLRELLEQGWGNAWGIFLTSSRAPAEIWHEMRRILMVTLESTQKLVYFRFYDPRVLRVFLPISDLAQRANFEAMGSSFFIEGETPDKLLRFQFLEGNSYFDELHF